MKMIITEGHDNKIDFNRIKNLKKNAIPIKISFQFRYDKEMESRDNIENGFCREKYI